MRAMLILISLSTSRYKWLDKKYVGTATKTIAKKVLLDQFIMTPQLLVAFYISKRCCVACFAAHCRSPAPRHLIWLLSLFFSAMAVLEGREDLFEEMRNKYLKTFQTSCLFWLPVQSVNFMFVPSAARVVYVGTSSLVWANILCWIKRQPTEPSEAKQD